MFFGAQVACSEFSMYYLMWVKSAHAVTLSWYGAQLDLVERVAVSIIHPVSPFRYRGTLASQWSVGSRRRAGAVQAKARYTARQHGLI